MNSERKPKLIEMKSFSANYYNNDIPKKEEKHHSKLKKSIERYTTFIPNCFDDIVSNSEKILDLISIGHKHKNRKKTFQNWNSKIQELSPKHRIHKRSTTNNRKFTHEIFDEITNKILILKEEENLDEEYNPYLIPVNFDLLEKHIKANKFGFHPNYYDFCSFNEFCKKKLCKEKEETIKTMKEIVLEIIWNVEKVSSLKGANEELTECPCCEELIEKVRPSLWFSSEELRFLGYSYPLFMKILKSLIIFIGIPYFLVIFIPNLIFLAQKCQSNDETEMEINRFLFCETGSGVKNLSFYYEKINDRMVLDFIFSIYLIIITTLIRVYSLRYIKEFEQNNSDSRLTILTRNLPKDIQESQIMEYFENFEMKKNNNFCCFKNKFDSSSKCKNYLQKPLKIHYIYNLSDYLGVSEKIVSLIHKRRKYLALLTSGFKNENKEKDPTHQTRSSLLSTFNQHIKEELKNIDKEILLAHNKKSEIFQSLKQNPQEFFQKRFMGKAFIDFQDEAFVRELINVYESFHDERRKNFKGERIYLEEFIEETPSPEELHWENIGLPYKKLFLRISVFIFEIVVLAACAVIIRVVYSNMKYHTFALETVVGLIVLFLNRILFWTIQKLVSLEKHKTLSKTEKRMIFISFSFFLFNIVVYELIGYLDFVFDGKIFHSGKIKEDTEEFEVFVEVIHKISFIALFLSLIEPPLKFIFNYKYFVKLYERYQIKKNPDRYCQQEAHEIFEGLEFELSEYYADFLLIYVLGLLSSPFYPPSYLIVIVGLVLQYWLFKINLIYRCKVEAELCKKLIYTFLRVINLSPIFYIFGIYMNLEKLKSENYNTAFDFDGYQVLFLLEIILIFILSKLNFKKIVEWKLKIRSDRILDLEAEKKTESGFDQLESIFKHEK